MIRFSAALVAVAIGVLIGGIATSKLLLVYIAIVVSAVALLALTIGVVLKRGELFGEGQVPADAGSAPAPSARAGETQVQPRQEASVPSSAPATGPTTGYGAAFGSAPLEGAAFEEAVFAGAAQAAPVTAVPPPAEPSTPHRPPAGQGRDRVADPVPSWEAQSARDQWSSSPWQGRPVAGSPAVGSSAGGPPVTGGAPDWMPGARGANGPAVQAEQSAPSSPPAPASSAPASSAPASSAPAGSVSGPENASRSWFNRQAQPPAAAQPAAAGTQADPDPPPAPADEDDDWPTRYSWLDDEPEQSPAEAHESDTPANPADDADIQAEDTDDRPVPEASAPAGSGHGLAQDAPADDTPATATGSVSAPPTAPAPATGTASVPAPPAVSAPPAVPAPPTVRAPATGTAGVPAPPAVPAPAFDPDPDPEQNPLPADGEPPAADLPVAAEADGLVAVLGGVPRYHQPDCVLIRFLPEDDIKRLPVAQAKADGCTPCAACQPAE